MSLNGLTGRTEKITRLRAVIARRMVESLQVSAQLTTVIEVDFAHAAQARERAKDRFAEQHAVKLTYLPIMASAALEALRDHPVINASLDAEKREATYYDSRNLSIAVDTEHGLLVPVIRDADNLTIAELGVAISKLAQRAREGKLMPDDMAGGTFTITNTGSRGALFDTPIINQPQVAILGTGTVVDRPVAVTAADGQMGVAIHPMGFLSLSYDHRLVDGAAAARYLGDVKRLLESPIWLESRLASGRRAGGP